MLWLCLLQERAIPQRFCPRSRLLYEVADRLHCKISIVLLFGYVTAAAAIHGGRALTDNTKPEATFAVLLSFDATGV